MPFRESSPVEERIGLFREYETGAFSVTELCARHGISRETFYVWSAAVRAGSRTGSRREATRSRPVRMRRQVGWPTASSRRGVGFRISARRRSRHGSNGSGPRSTGRRPRRSATSSSARGWWNQRVAGAVRSGRARW